MFIRKKNYQSLLDDAIFAKSKASIYKTLWQDISKVNKDLAKELEKAKALNKENLEAAYYSGFEKGKLDMFNKMKQKIAMDGFVGYNKDADK